MGKKVKIGNSEAILLTERENDVKQKIIKYLFDNLNLSLYRYIMLENIKNLNYLENNEHWVAPNYKGHSYFLIFKTIDNVQYCVLIEKKKFSYHRNKLDMNAQFIVKLQVNTNNNMFSGTIFEGKIISNQNQEYSFLIQDCYYLMGKKLTDMELNNKMLYLNDSIDTNLLGKSICSNFMFKLSTLYKYEDIPKLVYDMMPASNFQSNGLIFYPKVSGITFIHIEKKIEKPNIKIEKTEKTEKTEILNVTSLDLIFNFKEFLMNRTYSYENGNIKKNLWLKKSPSKTPDVYDVYSDKNEPKIGIAHVPNLKTSFFCSERIKNDFKLFKCVFVKKFNKWLPLEEII